MSFEMQMLFGCVLILLWFLALWAGLRLIAQVLERRDWRRIRVAEVARERAACEMEGGSVV